ncbi:MAG: ABC transporter permease [Bacteroidota bacterium]|nr:ABC transporter permease [Bacteroidota bacterium]
MKLFINIGQYISLMGKVFSRPERFRMFLKQVFKEIEIIGMNSLGIIAIVSVFMGAVLSLQAGINFIHPLIPNYLIGLTVRDTMILEFASTIICLILAGKVGSNIASEIGTMRITEQIDALEIMGVNSATHLILPKIIAALIFFPILTLISIMLGIAGGIAVSVLTDVVTLYDYLDGLRLFFNPYYIFYTMVKMIVYAFIITTVSSYHGYYTSGGALEVGKSSTKAVVYSIIAILVMDLVITELMLT